MSDVVSARKKLKKQLLLFVLSLVLVILGCLALTRVTAYAAPGVSIDFIAGEGEGSMGAIDVMVLFILLALAPSMVLMMTSFTRIIIVLSFMRNALGTQQSPPNQILVGLALCLTLFIMMPVLEEINTVAYKPYKDGEMTQTEALQAAATPIKKFMIRETSLKSLNLFLRISGGVEAMVDETATAEEIQSFDLTVLIPAFVTSELEHAFWMGFLLFMPFLIIDMVVSSVLMSMGMVMLPPAMISLPFKILMFVLVDGWGLLMGTLVQGFL